jgi:uncharacterized 2Fe-2S/4Fe-4S cluster protein (DUF4445 family)
MVALRQLPVARALRHRRQAGREQTGRHCLSHQPVAIMATSTIASLHTLLFPDLDREAPARSDESIFQSARRNGVRIVGACGGRGTCGTCVVHIVEGEVELMHADDAAISGERSAKKWVRACQMRARSDCTVEIAPRSLAPVVRSEVQSGEHEVLPLDPLVTSHDITLIEASLDDPRADAERLAAALPVPFEHIDIAAARELSPLLRKSHWALRVRQRGSELIGFAPTGSPTLGLAVDLGTTNAAAFLVDLQSGVRLASLGIENPQVAWGADLISRINYAIQQSGGAEELRRAAVTAINALAHDLCHAVGARSEHIVDVVICGNTAMHHLLLGLPVSQLGRAPFVAAVRDGLDIKARDLGLAVCPGAYVHIAANVGGFVGGDHVTALLATEERWRKATTSLVMDIGTNTEISLIHRGEILSASCPSGPALEGGHISCGMRAAEGAIERVSTQDGRITVQVIGGSEPVGLCGSGVLDALATLHRAGIVDARGRITAQHPDVTTVDGKRAAQLAPGVHFTQDDVRAVQLAKAAIRTGVELLLRKVQLTENDIEHFIIAGAFGAYIDVKSGIAIGLFPDLPSERFVQVGNAAGIGVRQMLASRTARTRASELAAACRYVELSAIPEFQKVFLQNIGFTNATSTKATP